MRARSVVLGTLLIATSAGSAAAHAAAGSVDLRVIEAVRQRDGKALAALLKGKGVDVNTRQPDGATALHWAANLDDVPAAEQLLRAGADADAANDYDVTPLMLAAENGSAKMVAALLKGGAQPNKALPSGETVLMIAARTGGAAAVDALAGRGADVNAAEKAKGQTPLMWAVSEQHLDVARTLIARGAHVNAAARSGFTALMFAARTGDIETARLLLKHGADVNAAAADGTAAILIAAVRGNVPMAEFLLENGANPNTDAAGYSALHWASGLWEGVTSHDYHVEDGEWSALRGVPRQKEQLIKALLAHGANPNTRMTKQAPRYGYNLFQERNVVSVTPFFLAALSGDIATMRLLVAGGANPQIRSGDGTTALMAAAGSAWVENESLVPEDDRIAAAKLCLDLGIDVNATNNAGAMALHSTIQGEFNRVIQFLADNGANPNIRDKAGYTPLRRAEDPAAASRIRVRAETAALLRKLGGTL